MSGHRYLLDIAEPARFRAQGLDAAHRIARRVTEAVAHTLAHDPEVLVIERSAIARESLPPCTESDDCIANLHNRACPRRRG